MYDIICELRNTHSNNSKDITPSSESARSDVLEYDEIEGIVDGHRPYVYPRLRNTFEAPEGSFEELDAARQEAFQYLLFTVEALQRAATPEARSV